MANGKVCTGFSKPWVAVYSNSGTTVTYTGGMVLARGVEVSVEPDSSDSNDFYADNMIAESANGVFNGGSATITVDGLKNAAEKMIFGLATPTELTVGSSTVDVYHYGDGQTVPFVGLGFVVRYMENGVTTYAPCVLPKVKFDAAPMSAATQEEEIDWQTQELTAQIHRDDTANHDWKLLAEDQTSEDAAEAVIKAILGVTT